MNDPVSDKDKPEILVCFLLETFGSIALMADASNMDYVFIGTLVKSEIERRKVHVKVTNTACRKEWTNAT